MGKRYRSEIVVGSEPNLHPSDDSQTTHDDNSVSTVENASILQLLMKMFAIPLLCQALRAITIIMARYLNFRADIGAFVFFLWGLILGYWQGELYLASFAFVTMNVCFLFLAFAFAGEISSLALDHIYELFIAPNAFSIGGIFIGQSFSQQNQKPSAENPPMPKEPSDDTKVFPPKLIRHLLMLFGVTVVAIMNPFQCSSLGLAILVGILGAFALMFLLFYLFSNRPLVNRAHEENSNYESLHDISTQEFPRMRSPSLDPKITTHHEEKSSKQERVIRFFKDLVSHASPLEYIILVGGPLIIYAGWCLREVIQIGGFLFSDFMVFVGVMLVSSITQWFVLGIGPCKK